LIFGGLLLGCAGQVTETESPPSPTSPTELTEVERNLDQVETQWQAQDLSDYRFQFRWQCFCPEDYRELVWITVRGGEITSVETVDPDSDVTPLDNSEYRTVDGLFDLIRDGIEEEAYEIRVEYDDAKGYPASLYIDYEANIVDEERGFSVSSLEELQ
jgi:hypothetical protein